MVSAEVNTKGVLLNLARIERLVEPAAKNAKLDVAYEVMRLSQLEVPHDEGTLQNSGTVEELPNGDIVAGYHTKYAARLHEHPEYRFQKGRKGKYLEDPINKNASVLGLTFGRNVQMRLF